MSNPAPTYRRAPAELPWPAGWARTTRGPQYRPALVLGVLSVLAATLLGLYNLADAFVMLVLAVGLFVWALRPAVAPPVVVSLAGGGVRFPLRPSILARWRPAVVLTPSAVVVTPPAVVPAPGGRTVVPWSHITEVRATTAEAGAPHPLLPPPVVNWLIIGAAGGPTGSSAMARRFGPAIVTGFPTTALRSHPVVLYHALHYYLDNPHARPELATPHAITRIREARVEPHDA